MTDSNDDSEHSKNQETETETEDENRFIHPEWRRGKACPECSGTTMFTLQLSAEIYKHEDGEYKHLDWRGYCEPAFVRCQDCGEVLFDHPDVKPI